MAKPDDAARIAAALRIVQNWARSRRARIERRALDTAEALGFDPDDVYAVLLAAELSRVHAVEPDDQFPERTVIVLKFPAEECLLYVKVSLNVEIDHEVRILSFKEWQ